MYNAKVSTGLDLKALSRAEYHPRMTCLLKESPLPIFTATTSKAKHPQLEERFKARYSPHKGTVRRQTGGWIIYFATL